MRLGFQWGTSDSNSAHCMALENVKVGINCVLLSFTAFATFILYQSNKRKKVVSSFIQLFLSTYESS